jgi:ubiquitin-conjugating enzyme E2 I
MGIQDLLDNPNINSPAQAEPYIMFTNNKDDYNKRIKLQAEANSKK